MKICRLKIRNIKLLHVTFEGGAGFMIRRISKLRSIEVRTRRGRLGLGMSSVGLKTTRKGGDQK